MDAISRNTASVAQDFHKAGGVHELKIPANHQLLFNNKLPTSQWTTREAAAILHSLSNIAHNNNNNNNTNNANPSAVNGYQQQHRGLRKRQHSTGEDDENTPSSGSSTTSSSLSGDELMSLSSSASVSPTMKKQFGSLQQQQQQQLAAAAVAAVASGAISIEEQEQQHKAMTKIATAFLEAAYEQNAIELLAHNKQQQQQQQQQYNNKYHQQHHNHKVVVVAGDVGCVNDEDQENKVQLIKSPPAYKLNQNFNSNNKHTQRTNKIHRNAVNNITTTLTTTTTTTTSSGSSHRLDDKENSIAAAAPGGSASAGASYLTQMEYQNLNKIETQFQNYVKDIISKYYAAETPPLLLPAMPTPTTTAQQSQSDKLLNGCGLAPEKAHPTSEIKRKRILSETEEYIEYLKNKEDITLTITPKVPKPKQQMKKEIIPSTTIQHHSLLKREQDLHASSSRHRPNPKKMRLLPPPPPPSPPVVVLVANNSQQPLALIGNPSPPPPLPPQPVANSNRKSLNQLATLLPLLADAASKQQYLTTPLDFSKKPSSTSSTTSPPASLSSSSNGLSTSDKRSSRKQAKPKKIRLSPVAVVAMLRDKHLHRMVHHKLICGSCTYARRRKMLIFGYHTKGSLALHRFWKHNNGGTRICKTCKMNFKQHYSLAIHKKLCRCCVPGKIVKHEEVVMEKMLPPKEENENKAILTVTTEK